MKNSPNISCESFFPKIYKIVNIIESEDKYEFWLLSRSTSGICNKCNKTNYRVHDYQLRKDVRDLPILGKPVYLSINQVKYYCDNPECDVEIFTESNELIDPYTRFTRRCSKYILSLATHVSAETAAKILALQGIKVSGDTLLNMLKKAVDTYGHEPPTKIGVDDWSYRKGHTYGTIICDLDTHEVIDVLEGRDAETLEKWLREHPGIEYVSRDRASSYSSAVTNVFPNAVQIADRFHILQNMITALNESLKECIPQNIKIPNTDSNETNKQPAIPPAVKKKASKYKNAEIHK